MGERIDVLVVGLYAKKILEQRMAARKIEEKEEIEKGFSYYSKREIKKKKMPIVWIFIDEVHEFLPQLDDPFDVVSSGLADFHSARCLRGHGTRGPQTLPGPSPRRRAREHYTPPSIRICRRPSAYAWSPPPYPLLGRLD